MNAEEIYQKYIAPTPEPKPEPEKINKWPAIDTPKELLTSIPNWAQPDPPGPRWRNGAGAHMPTYSAEYKQPTFEVTKVEISKNCSTFLPSYTIGVTIRIDGKHFQVHSNMLCSSHVPTDEELNATITELINYVAKTMVHHFIEDQLREKVLIEVMKQRSNHAF